MKSMIWTPDEEHDRLINAYLDAENHASYLSGAENFHETQAEKTVTFENSIRVSR